MLPAIVLIELLLHLTVTVKINKYTTVFYDIILFINNSTPISKYVETFKYLN